jgi:hypothetical protein
MDDDALMMLVQESLATDRVMSARAREAALAAAGWVRTAEQFAEVAFDSAAEPALAGLRGGRTDTHELTYRSAELTVECRFGPDGLMGEILPPGPARVWLRTPRPEERELAVDEYGRFTDTGLPTGPVSLKISRIGLPDLTTPWLLP